MLVHSTLTCASTRRTAVPPARIISSQELVRLINAAMARCRECAAASRLTWLDVVRTAPDASGCDWEVPALAAPSHPATAACARCAGMREALAELRASCRLGPAAPIGRPRGR